MVSGRQVRFGGYGLHGDMWNLVIDDVVGMGQWHHVLCGVDGQNRFLLIDGGVRELREPFQWDGCGWPEGPFVIGAEFPRPHARAVPDGTLIKQLRVYDIGVEESDYPELIDGSFDGGKNLVLWTVQDAFRRVKVDTR